MAEVCQLGSGDSSLRGEDLDGRRGGDKHRREFRAVHCSGATLLPGIGVATAAGPTISAKAVLTVSFTASATGVRPLVSSYCATGNFSCSASTFTRAISPFFAAMCVGLCLKRAGNAASIV